MEMILDVQGFLGPDNNFVAKELSVISIDEASELHLCRLLFKPPCPWEALPTKSKITNSWLTRHRHGLEWISGDISFDDVPMVARKVVELASYVYVKGAAKKKWLDEILIDKSAVDLETLDCPNLETLRNIEVMGWHGDDHGGVRDYSCTFQNVQRLKQWYLKNCGPSLMKSLHIHEQIGDLHLMKAEDIAQLDKDLILLCAGHNIDAVWDKLPESIQKEVASYRRCQKHYCSMIDDQFDGPIPMIKDCVSCQKLNKCS